MPRPTVFFFGAGASKAERGLLTSELLLESLKEPNVKSEFRSIIEQFLNDLFKVRSIEDIRSTSQLPSYEEILTLVDVALLKQEEFSYYWNRTKLLELREALVYCIAKILKIKLQPREEENPTPQYHRLFVQNILNERRQIDPSDYSFISLNYDILLDYALIDLYPRWHVDYGISFRKFHEPHPDQGIKLLKLHGSLNWMFCPVCNTMKLNLKGKIADIVISEEIPCDLDDAAQRPVIIPPTWLKVYDNAYLVKIWLEAEHTLRRANEVFFIGYSLPESDIHVRYLLKKSLFRKDTPPRIVVITSPRNKEGSDLHRRYERFFGVVEYHPVGFESFSSDVEKYISASANVEN